MRAKLLTVTAVAALLPTGCTGPTSVAGKVTLDGTPLDGALVMLTPPGRGSDFVLGTTGPDGRFIITPAVGKSVPYGKYTVTVSRRELLTPAQMASFITPKETLPEKYSELTKSVLMLEVPTSGDVEFALTTK